MVYYYPSDGLIGNRSHERSPSDWVSYVLIVSRVYLHLYLELSTCDWDAQDRWWFYLNRRTEPGSSVHSVLSLLSKSHFSLQSRHTKRHARTLICVVSPLPGGSWWLFFFQRKRNEVKDDFANFCDWCHSPTFHPLTWHMTLITINDDSDDMALLSVCGREKENPSKACSMLFRPFMGQKRLLLWWLFTDNLDVFFFFLYVNVLTWVLYERRYDTQLKHAHSSAIIECCR